jgi:hypothetical protein
LLKNASGDNADFAPILNAFWNIGYPIERANDIIGNFV